MKLIELLRLIEEKRIVDNPMVRKSKKDRWRPFSVIVEQISFPIALAGDWEIKPEIVKVWVNMYNPEPCYSRNSNFGHIHLSKEAADNVATSSRIKCICLQEVEDE